MEKVEIEEGKIPPHMEDHVTPMRHEFNMHLQHTVKDFTSQQVAYQVML